MLKELKEEAKKVEKIMCEQNGNTKKEKTIHQNNKQTKKSKPEEILEMNSIIAMRNSLEGFESRFHHTEERISDDESRTMEIIESEGQEDKSSKKKKRKQSLTDLWDTSK